MVRRVALDNKISQIGPGSPILWQYVFLRLEMVAILENFPCFFLIFQVAHRQKNCGHAYSTHMVTGHQLSRINYFGNIDQNVMSTHMDARF